MSPPPPFIVRHFNILYRKYIGLPQQNDTHSFLSRLINGSNFLNYLTDWRQKYNKLNEWVCEKWAMCLDFYDLQNVHAGAKYALNISLLNYYYLSVAQESFKRYVILMALRIAFLYFLVQVKKLNKWICTHFYIQAIR